MSDQISPGTVPAPIVQNYVAMLWDQAQRMNAQTVAFYNFLLATAQSNRSRGLPATDPDPSQFKLKVVNEAWVTQFEQGQIATGAPDETYVEVPYVPPPGPIIVAKPLVGGPDAFLPGYFVEGPGDNPTYKEGFETHQNGVKYRKVVIGHSPLSPDGNLYRWIPVQEQTPQ